MRTKQNITEKEVLAIIKKELPDIIFKAGEDSENIL